jgi:hypothetical protein
MRPFTLIPLLVTLALPAIAQETYSGAEFDARVAGKTIAFTRQGRPFGTEQYFSDKRVIWARPDATCERGIWFENTSGQICFVYENTPDAQCWDFFKLPGGGMSARSDGADPANDLTAARESTEPLDCPLPDLGV